MKKFLHIIVLLIFGLKLSTAQDIIYTISGEVDSKKVALDSILVENLTNKTWISFNNLPQHDIYQINLTKKAFWGTVGNNLIGYDNQFSVIQNQPGIIEVAFINDKPETVDITLYNINGQKLFSDFGRIIYPGNSIRVQPGQSGVFILRVESQRSAQNFKLIGSSYRYGDVFEIVASNWHKPVTKNALIYNDFNFSFSPGDNIRVSVFKTNHFAEPFANNISGNRDLIFQLESHDDSLTAVINGKIDLNEFSGLDLSELNIESLNGTSPVKINGTLHIPNTSFGDKHSPIFITQGENELFGFIPDKEDEFNVTVDNIILYYISLFPDIYSSDISNSALISIIRNSPDYQRLKDIISTSINLNQNPFSNGDFKDLITASSIFVAQNMNESPKKADLYEFFDKQFNIEYDRNGKIKLPDKSPIFTGLGYEIRNEDEVIVFGPKILEPSKIMYSPSSLLEWGLDKVIDLVIENDNLVDLKNLGEGYYVIFFNNGNEKGYASDELYSYTRKVNNDELIINLIFLIIPSVYKDYFSPCIGSIFPLFVSAGETISDQYRTGLSPGEIASALYQLQANIFDVMFLCAKKEMTMGKFFKFILGHYKILDVFQTSEKLVNWLGSVRDFKGSKISGFDTRSFYDDISFGDLKLEQISPHKFNGITGSNHEFTAKLLEKTTTFEISRGFLETTIKRVESQKDADGLPFKALLIDGDATLDNDIPIKTKDGILKGKFTMGEKKSEYKFEPGFKESEITIDPVYLNPSVPSIIELISGNNQDGLPGEQLKNEIRVLVKDDEGNPIAGITVIFYSSCDECGKFSPGILKTDENGYVASFWMIGEKIGEQAAKVVLADYDNVPPIILTAKANGDLLIGSWKLTSINGVAIGQIIEDFVPGCPNLKLESRRQIEMIWTFTDKKLSIYDKTENVNYSNYYYLGSNPCNPYKIETNVSQIETTDTYDYIRNGNTVTFEVDGDIITFTLEFIDSNTLYVSEFGAIFKKL